MPDSSNRGPATATHNRLNWLEQLGRSARDTISVIPQRLRQRRFWRIQFIVFAVTAFHYGLEMSGRVEAVGLLHDISMSLFTIPLLSAALLFGWEGAIMTGILASMLLAPATLLFQEGDLLWLSEVTQLAVVLAVGLVVAWRVNRESQQREIAERTNRELLDAQREADEASQAKSEFLSRMSHELRTPLNVILGFGQLLEMDTDKESREEYLAHILAAGHHLLDLVNEALDLSRAESGRMAISVEPVELQATIIDAVQMIEPLAAERHISLTTAFSEGACWAKADNQRLKQVFLNLLSNAIKYSSEGGSVVVSARRLAGGRIRADVIDTGPGIPPDKVDRLFAPFDRLGAEATQIEGTGLGLTIAKTLVEAMGGSIGVETTTGEGSTFWLELEPSLPLARQALATTLAPAGKPIGTNPLRVLYIDDNSANLTLIRKVCERRPSVQLSTATDGMSGLELARRERPDLILLDLHLPDISGVDVLAQLRGEAALADIPVVMVSADAIPSQIQALLAAGARRYVTKPIHIEEILSLFDEVAESLTKSRASGDNRSGGTAVLVVEDDAPLRKLIARILNGQGYEVFTAADAFEAIAVCESVAVNLLVADVTLPGMLGTELARIVQERRPETAVLFVTGHAVDELAPSTSRPTEALLQKPFTADSLVSAAGMLLAAGRQTSPAA